MKQIKCGCDLCINRKMMFTDPGSNNKAEVALTGMNILTFWGDDGVMYSVECNYCPKCGRLLTQHMVSPGEMSNY